MQKKLARLLAALLILALLAGCGGKNGVAGAKTIKRPAVESAERQFAGPAEGDTVAVFDTSAGEIRAVLYTDAAPQACANFIGLAQSGFYDETLFYYTLPGFCVKAGVDADGVSSTIWNGSGFAPETTDALHHYSGALCAPTDGQGLCGGVFYFMQTLPQAPEQALLDQMAEAGYRQQVIDAYTAAGGAPYLDYTDTVFGQVYAGMDVVDAIAQAQTDEDGKPLEDIVIRSVTIETYRAA